jgi:hypothetical protein
VRINSVLAQFKLAPPAIEKSDLPALLDEAYAGFWMRPLNNYSAEYHGLAEPKGVIVVDVERGSLAERAGLLPGDILIRVNGKPVVGMDDATFWANTILPGEFVEGVVWRNRREIAVSGLTQRAPLDRLLGRIAAARLKEKNYDRARVFIEYLAATDDAHGQMLMGDMYLRGVGVKRDISVAASWLLKAALQGKALAAALLSESIRTLTAE